jgi:hypothetical protein
MQHIKQSGNIPFAVPWNLNTVGNGMSGKYAAFSAQKMTFPSAFNKTRMQPFELAFASPEGGSGGNMEYKRAVARCTTHYLAFPKNITLIKVSVTIYNKTCGYFCGIHGSGIIFVVIRKPGVLCPNGLRNSRLCTLMTLGELLVYYIIIV